MQSVKAVVAHKTATSLRIIRAKQGSFSKEFPSSSGPFKCTSLAQGAIKLSHSSVSHKECFLLGNGIGIGWSMNADELSELLRNKEIELEEREFLLPSLLVVESKDLENRFCLSMAIAQLVELERLEEQVQEKLQTLQNVLSTINKHRLFRRNPSRATLLQNVINIHQLKLQFSQLTNNRITSEEKELLQQFKESLGLNERFELLNGNLQVLEKLCHWQREFVEHKHSLALEWGIILLIAGEIALNIVKIVAYE
jgi:uncharacterized Rmd1/YagE family protein